MLGSGSISNCRKSIVNYTFTIEKNYRTTDTKNITAKNSTTYKSANEYLSNIIIKIVRFKYK